MINEDVLQRNSTEGPEAHAAGVSNAFDSIAATFDSTLENEITLRLRVKIYSLIETLVPLRSRLLDINCGTGIDGINLSMRGYRVSGIDISQKMIAAAKKKLDSENFKNVDFSVLSFDRLSSQTFPAADLVLSNFGGLNCTADLRSVISGIASVTKPGGFFVGVIMPPFSLWEFFAFGLRLDWSHAVRRFRDHADATGFKSASFPVYYHLPSTVARVFSPFFALKNIIGLNIMSPNPQSTRFATVNPHLTSMLNSLDELIERLPLFRSIGDHYIIILQKRQ